MVVEQVRVQRRFDCDPATVWARYVDHARWSEWAGTPRSRLEREGVPAPNGVGAIRVFARVVKEEVTEFEAPARLGYKVIAGVPIRNHSGTATFEAEGPRTVVTWQCSFTPIVPGSGALLRRLFTTTFRRALDGLARDLAGSAVTPV